MDYTEQEATVVHRILEEQNFYDILQLSNDATVDDIKNAHKKLALLVHPDKNNHPRAKEAFVSVRRATAVLLDKEKRREYDEYLRSPRTFAKEKFEMSDDAIDAVLIGAGIMGAIGIVAGIFALFSWLTSPKKKEEPKYA